MAHAYTPGLKVSGGEVIKKKRILPIKGEVLVKEGERVRANDVVARTYLPGNVEPMNLSHLLSVNPDEVPGFMKKNIGDRVSKGEMIAKTNGIFGMFKTSAVARIDGKIESVSDVTGQVILRGDPTPIELKAYIDGLVTKVIPEQGIEVETYATFVQGIFGIGGETNGEMVFVCDDPAEILDEARLNDAHQGKIVVGGQMVTARAIRKAVSIGIKAVVCGGIDDKDLRDFMKCDIGVAITGSENLGITLVITEGFSGINMSDRTFELLKKNEGRFVCVNGATQIRAGVLRPEVIIPKSREGLSDLDEKKRQLGITIGSPVRLIREPYFGKLGVVTGLPSELTRLESWSMARVCKVKVNGNDEVVIPRANVEIIES